MPNHCTVRGCLTNYKGHEQGSVFLLPKNEVQRTEWLKFINYTYIESLKKVYVCFKHFETKFLLPSKKGVKLNHMMNPVPTIIPNTQKSINLPSAAVMETIRCPRKAPKQRIFQEDELLEFKKETQLLILMTLLKKRW